MFTLARFSTSHKISDISDILKLKTCAGLLEPMVVKINQYTILTILDLPHLKSKAMECNHHVKHLNSYSSGSEYMGLISLAP